MVSAGPGVEVTVLVAKSEVLNYNNLSKSKENAISGRSVVKRRTGRGQTGSQGNRVLRVWLMRERERERSQVEEPDKDLKLGIPLTGTSSTALKPTNWTALSRRTFLTSQTPVGSRR